MEARNKLSEVVDRALSEGPQTITRRSKQVAVVISTKDLERLRKPKGSLVQFLAASPLKGLRLRIERDKDPGRAVDRGL